MLTPGAHEERRNLEARLLALRIGLATCVGLLAVAFWVLQVVQWADYARIAENNHLRTIPLRAPRGVLFDRDGRVLVKSEPSFTIALVREQSADLDAAVRTLAAVIGADEASLRARLDKHRRDPVFRPIPVVEHATFAQVAAVTARKLELPEVVVQRVPTRSYPANALGAHLFGYVSEIRESQIDRPEFASLQAGAIVGQTGLERTYNARLMGEDGNRFVVVDSVGREIEELNEQVPIDGQALQLTIDYDLQRALEDAFRESGFAGAAAFLVPDTGEVLAMTSLPAYDPNAFATGIDAETFARMNSDPQKPFNNRPIQGRYSPGSTFKIVMAITALMERVTTTEERIYCPGYGTYFGRRFACNRKTGHGWMDIRHAIAQSCNVFFYTMGERMKVDTIRAYAEKLGLVGPTGIDLPNEIDSRVPSEAWARDVRNDRWYPSETISVAIGQGPVDVTPLALATMMATVANGGSLVTPHLVRGVHDGSGWQPVQPPAARSQVTIPPDVLSAIRDGLWMTVNQDGGTGWRARLAGRDVSGKTGTAQVISNMNRAAAEATGRDFRDNGWFVFLAPRDNPQIAGVVFVEHGGGAAPAMPIARHVLETFFAKRDGLPLPPLDPDSIQRNIRASASTGAPGPAAQASAPAPRPAGGNPTGGGRW